MKRYSFYLVSAKTDCEVDIWDWRKPRLTKRDFDILLDAMQWYVGAEEAPIQAYILEKGTLLHLLLLDPVLMDDDTVIVELTVDGQHWRTFELPY